MNQVPTTVTAVITTLAQLPAQMVVAWATKNGYSLGAGYDQSLAMGITLLLGMAAQRLAVVNQAFDDIVAAGAASVVSRWKGTAKAPAAPSQAGTATVAMLLAALALPLVGCGFMTQKQEALPDSKTLTKPGDEALKAIVFTKEGLDVAANFIADSTNQGMLDPVQGRRWLEQLKTYRARLADAEKLFSSGSFDAAKMQAEGQKALIKFIHDQAIEAVKRSATPKPAGLVQILWQEEFQPTRRLAWTRY